MQAIKKTNNLHQTKKLKDEQSPSGKQSLKDGQPPSTKNHSTTNNLYQVKIESIN